MNIFFSILFFTSATALIFLNRKTEIFFTAAFLFSISAINLYSAVNYYSIDLSGFQLTKSFILLAVPSISVYTKSLLANNFILKKRDRLHFLPFMVYFVLTLVLLIEKTTGIFNHEWNFIDIEILCSILCLILWLVYSIFQLDIILHFLYLINVADYVHKSEIFSWIRIYSVVAFALFSGTFFNIFLTQSIALNFLFISILSGYIFILPVKWFYLKKYNFRSFNSSTSRIQEKSQNLIDEIPDLDKHMQNIENAFNVKKIFLIKNLTLRDVAIQTKISPKYITKAIKYDSGLSFTEYVNFHRVEYIKQKIIDNEWCNLKIKKMAAESGFCSRTTCFRAFVRNTGKSPSEYLNNIRSDNPV